tara:strand:- start:1665 stop:1844 length:180 start_codon:yes stop_codon:yes gene_type:complete
MSEGEYIRVYISIDRDDLCTTYETELTPMAFVNLIGDLIDREISGFSVSIKPPDTKQLH